jgi:adenylate cyclase
MPASMSLEEFAALVRMEPPEVADLAAAGLLDPAGAGEFDDLDLLRLMTVRHYQALGYSPERLAGELSIGEVRPFLGEYIYPRSEQLSLEEAAERSGIDPEMLRDLRTALGWFGDGFLEEDMQVLEGFKVIAGAGMPREATLEGARVYGDALRRVAETEVRLVHVHIHERLLAEGLPEDEVIRQIHALQEAALPVLDGMVERVHHEHFLQASIEDAYVHLVDTEVDRGRGSVDATIVFVDVESFTTITEAEGDQAAIDTMTRVDSTVRALAHERDGKVVKHIGDALMLAFRRPTDAVGFAGALHHAAEADPSLPGLRLGMHCGPAVYRAGDYIGNTVNLASRVAGTATAGETVLTEPVVEKLDDAGAVEKVGVRMLRGAQHPVQLYRLRHDESRADPVCGQIVSAPPAARLQRGDDELWFCSERCLRQFLAAAQAAP